MDWLICVSLLSCMLQRLIKALKPCTCICGSLSSTPLPAARFSVIQLSFHGCAILFIIFAEILKASHIHTVNSVFPAVLPTSGICNCVASSLHYVFDYSLFDSCSNVCSSFLKYVFLLPVDLSEFIIGHKLQTPHIFYVSVLTSRLGIPGLTYPNWKYHSVTTYLDCGC